MTCGGIDDDDERMKRSGLAAMTSLLRGARQDGLVHGRHGGVPGGPASSIQAKNFSALKPGVQNTCGARRQRRQHAGDQAVDVEQRHDVQAAILGVNAACADVAWPTRRGCAATAARSSAATWCPRCAAPSPHRRAAPGRRWAGGVPPRRRAAQRELAGAGARAAPVRSCARPASAPRRWPARCCPLDDQRLGVQVGQVELELVGPVGRVQRRAGHPQQAMKQVAISGPLGSTMATRSLRPMPRRVQRATVRLGAHQARSSSSCPPAPAAAPTRWRASSRAWSAKHKLMKQPIIVVNKSGGAGAEGFLDVKGAKGNPHKIIITLSNLFTTPLATGVPFNWRDMTPVQMLALDQFVLWVNAESPHKTAKDYLAASRPPRPTPSRWAAPAPSRKTRSSPCCSRRPPARRSPTCPSRAAATWPCNWWASTSTPR
jgi:hypothetical protein